MSHKQMKYIVAAITAAAIMVLIFIFSSQPARVSGGLSKEISRKLLEWFPVLNDRITLGRLNYYLRKLAHFAIYFALGVCLTVAAGRQKKLPPLLVSILIGTAFAASDEVHQIFSDGRGPMVRDVVLDACGVVAGSTLATACGRLTQKMRKGS